MRWIDLLFRKKEQPKPFLKNINNLQEIKIGLLTGSDIYEADTEDYLALLDHMKSLGLAKYIKIDLVRFTAFNNITNAKFNTLYNLYLVNLKKMLDSEKDYYVSDRKVILYGLRSCLTKIPFHLVFFENLWYIFTFDYNRDKFIAYPIIQNTRTPDLSRGMVFKSLGTYPSFWVEENEDIMYWTKPTYSCFY